MATTISWPARLFTAHTYRALSAPSATTAKASTALPTTYALMLRAVPDGDEHDKDIALAIRYAVDNGARVVNMSFGKNLSPGKQWVDSAVKYAESKGVLLIHA